MGTSWQNCTPAGSRLAGRRDLATPRREAGCGKEDIDARSRLQGQAVPAPLEGGTC